MLGAPPPKIFGAGSPLVEGIVEEVNDNDFEGLDNESEPPAIQGPPTIKKGKSFE